MESDEYLSPGGGERVPSAMSVINLNVNRLNTSKTKVTILNF